MKGLTRRMEMKVGSVESRWKIKRHLSHPLVQWDTLSSSATGPHKGNPTYTVVVYKGKLRKSYISETKAHWTKG
jgi:hypothetical protein